MAVIRASRATFTPRESSGGAHPLRNSSARPRWRKVVFQPVLPLPRLSFVSLLLKPIESSASVCTCLRIRKIQAQALCNSYIMIMSGCVENIPCVVLTTGKTTVFGTYGHKLSVACFVLDRLQWYLSFEFRPGNNSSWNEFITFTLSKWFDRLSDFRSELPGWSHHQLERLAFSVPTYIAQTRWTRTMATRVMHSALLRLNVFFTYGDARHLFLHCTRF